MEAKLTKASANMSGDLGQLAKMAVRDIQQEAQDTHVFKSRTGSTERSIEAEVTINGLRFTGEVFTINPVAIYQHEGTGLKGPKGRAFTIVPRNKTALRWAGGNGWAFAKKVINPGIAPDPYINNAAEKTEPAIVSRFEVYIAGLTGR